MAAPCDRAALFPAVASVKCADPGRGAGFYRRQHVACMLLLGLPPGRLLLSQASRGLRRPLELCTLPPKLWAAEADFAPTASRRCRMAARSRTATRLRSRSDGRSTPQSFLQI